MIGDATLFIRTDEVEQAWRIVDPYLQAWSDGRRPPLLPGRHLGAPRSRPAGRRSGDAWRTGPEPGVACRLPNERPGPSTTYRPTPSPQLVLDAFAGRAGARLHPRPLRVAPRPGAATSGWPTGRRRRRSTGRWSTSTWATSAVSRPTTPTPTSDWSASPPRPGRARWPPSTPCPVGPTRRRRADYDAARPGSRPSTRSTSVSAPTATRPRSSPARPASTAPTGTLVVANRRPERPQPPRADDPHLRRPSTRARLVVFTVDGRREARGLAREVWAGRRTSRPAGSGPPRSIWLVDRAAAGE